MYRACYRSCTGCLQTILVPDRAAQTSPTCPSTLCPPQAEAAARWPKRARASEGYRTPAQLAAYQVRLRGLPDLHAAVRDGDIGDIGEAGDVKNEEALAGVHGALDLFRLGGEARCLRACVLC